MHTDDSSKTREAGDCGIMAACDSIHRQELKAKLQSNMLEGEDEERRWCRVRSFERLGMVKASKRGERHSHDHREWASLTTSVQKAYE